MRPSATGPGPGYVTLKKFAMRRGLEFDDKALRSLRRQLQKKQSRIREKFLFQFAEGKGAPVYVTEPLMRKHCPEFYDRASETAELVRKNFRELHDQIRELKLRDGALGRRIKELSDQLAALEALRKPTKPDQPRHELPRG